MKEVTVLIPTWRPDRTLRELLIRLSRQALLPQRVLLLNTLDEGAAGEEEEEKIAALIAEFRDAFPVFSVFHVDRKDFDHGGTRRIGFGFARTELVLCMTQDALPRDSRMTEHLAAAFDDPLVAAAYGRQLAGIAPQSGAGSKSRAGTALHTATATNCHIVSTVASWSSPSIDIITICTA
jgi:rhamnosyltransferase